MPHDPEHLEKMRQAVMRFRELLDLMHNTLAEGEHAYQKLFDHLSPEQLNLPEKTRQGVAAEALLENHIPLSRAALHLQFSARNLERDFEQLHDNVVP